MITLGGSTARRKTRRAWLAGDEDADYAPTREDLKAMVHEELCRFDDNAEIRVEAVLGKLAGYDPLCLVLKADWQSAVRDCILSLWRGRAAQLEVELAEPEAEAAV